MVINIFVVALFVVVLISSFITVENKSKKNVDNDFALLTFNESTMYTLTPVSMNRIVYAKDLIRYKNRDVIYNGALMVKSKDSDNIEITDTLTSDLIVKRQNTFKFLNNVIFTRNNYITLNTDELLYDSKTKVALNTLPFSGNYFNNTIEGKNIYLDLNKYFMRAKQTHFEIDLKKENNL